MRNKFQPKTQREMVQVDLPSKVDRLQLYRRIEAVVDRRIREIHVLLDTRPRPVSLMLLSKADELPHPSTIGIRRRQIEYFRFEFLPTVSAALLLELEDLHEEEAQRKQKEQEAEEKKSATSEEETPSPSPPSLEEPIECIALLISNMLLVSKGNYDARVRSILKTVCTQILIESSSSSPQSLPLPSSSNLDDSLSSSSSTESEGSATAASSQTDQTDQPEHPQQPQQPLPTKQEQTSRSLYFLKFSDVDENNPVVHVNSDDEFAAGDDVLRTSTLPTLSPAQIASRQLETIERAIATDILKAALEKASRQEEEKQEEDELDKSRRISKRNQRVKQVLVRGLQITTVGVVVGAAFAFTGGLAAPGLVAAISALGIGTSSVAFATLTTVQALASLFGVVGGGLAAYKMKKRTQGLSEWRIRKETLTTSVGKQQDAVTIRGLHASVCVSGWLVDKSDFQRPWGIQPDDPEIKEKMELLQRFFAVHGPEKVHFCRALLKANKKNTRDLWIGLARRYGRDPDNLLPFDRTGEPQDLPEALERKVNGLLKYQVLRDEHATNMERIYETNNMLIKMEAMNTDISGKTREVLDALRETTTTDKIEEASEEAAVTEQSEVKGEESEGVTEESVTAEESGAAAAREDGETNQDKPTEPEVAPTEKGETNNEATPNESDNAEGPVEEPKEERKSSENGVLEEISPNQSDTKDPQEKEAATTTATPPTDNNAHEAPSTLDDTEHAATTSGQATTEEDVATTPSDDNEGETAFGSGVDSDALFDEDALLAKMEAANEEVMLDLSCSRSDAESSMNDSTEDIVLRDRLNEAVLSVDTVSAQDMKRVNSEISGQFLSWFRMNSFSPTSALDAKKHGSNGQVPTDKEPVKNCVSGETAETIEEDSADDSERSSGDGATLGKTDHDLIVWDWQSSYGGELYTVTWETASLLKLCKVVNVLALEVTDQVTKQVIQNALLAGTVAIPSAMVTCLAVVDDPYQLISFRSEKAGIELAHCLMQSDEHRPISMVGFSFGARVVFSCLLELARHQALWEDKQKKPESDDAENKSKRWSFKALNNKPKIDPLDDIDYTREPASIVEDVVVIGMPRLLEVKEWVTCREIVAGRLVNCYKKDDWIVSYMINVRCWNGVRYTCGTHPIDERVVLGVENFEVSDLVSTHGRYQLSVPQILHRVGYGTARK